MGTIIKNGVPYSGSSNPNAADVPYSNSTSGLSATNVQSAIDEMMTATTGTLSNPSSLLTVNSSHVERVGHIGILTVDVRASTDGFPAEAWTTLFTSSVKPTATFSDLRQNATGTITTRIETSGDVRLYAHNVLNKQIVRVIIPFIVA